MAATSKAVHVVCMGRHEMTLPVDFDYLMPSTAIFTPPELTEAGAPIEVTVHSAKVDAPQFKQLVDKRHAAILAADRKTTNVLKEVITLSKEATIFRIMDIDDAYTDELHLWKGGTYIVATSESFENSFKQAEARLSAFIGDVENTARTPQKGFCLGPIVVKGKYVGEYGNLAFRSKSTPDMLMTVTVDTFTVNDSQTLLQRVSGGDSLLSRLGAHPRILRKGELQTAGMRSQEWLAAFNMGENGGGKEYSFALETMRKTPAPLEPMIYIEFITGSRAADDALPRSALSDDEAMALWDGITRSFKVRSAQ